MTTKTQTYLKVKEGRTTLTVPHLDGELTFIHPSKGPNTYANVQEELIKDNLTPPTAAQTTSLIYAAFKDKDNKYSQEIRDIMKNRYLWCFTGNLYVPDKGVFIQDNPKIKDDGVSMKLSDLEKKIESNDPSVRFVEFGYKLEEQSPKELEKNLYIVGLVGEEGAEKLAEVADEHKFNPYVWSFENVEEETARATALGSGWGRDYLVVAGNYFVGYGDGFSFGVQ